MTRKQTAKMRSTGLYLVEGGEGTSSSNIFITLPQLSAFFLPPHICKFCSQLIYIRHRINLNDNITMYAAVRIR